MNLSRIFIIVLLVLGFKLGLLSQTSLEFNGTDSYIQINDNPALHLDNFTLECWIMLSDNGTAILTGIGGVRAYPILARGVEDPDSLSGVNFFLGIREEDHVLVADFETSPSDSIPLFNMPVIGFTSIIEQYWYHIAVTFDGKMMSLFLNGKLESSLQMIHSPFSSVASSLGIATTINKHSIPEGFFAGKIDAIRFWDFALTQDQLLAQINSEIETPEEGLIISLNLNEGHGILLNTPGVIQSSDITPNSIIWSDGAHFKALIPPRNISESLLNIGLISDPQYCDCDPGSTRKYRLTLQKLPEAIDTLNNHQLDYVITLGDVIDHYYPSYDSILPLYESITVPYHFSLGNHDFFEIDDTLKDNITGLLNMPDYYYDFDVENWKFLVLDGTEMAEYTSVLHPELAAEADSMRQSIVGQINDFEWNGGISRTQLAWIEDKLNTSLAANQKVIVYCHWPVFPYNTIGNLWNDTTLVDLLEKFPHVIAYINGHNHEGNYGFKSGIHFINQIAMVETEEYNSYSILEIYPEKLVTRGYGLNPDRVITYKDIYKELKVPSLSDTILYYYQDSGDFIGKILIGEESNIDFNYFLIGNNTETDNGYFKISNDSLFLNSTVKYGDKILFTLKIGAIDYAFDTISKVINIVFDTTVAILHTNINDIILSIDDFYFISPDSLFTDYSENGLDYSLQVANEDILTTDVSDNEFVLIPLQVGSTDVFLTAIDSNTLYSLHDTFAVTVFNSAINTIALSSANEILIYPNPAESFIIIRHALDDGLFSFILRNQLGQQIQFSEQEQFFGEERFIKLQINELQTGLYYLEIWYNKKHLTTQKILIK